MKKYMEDLPSGGTLIVTTNDWYIQYYFSGFDRRYKGTLFNISSVDIDKYIDAWESNFKKYLLLKSNNIFSLSNKASRFEIEGKMGMKIFLDKYFNGVSINQTKDMIVNKQEKIDKIVNDYQYAKQRAKAIENILKVL